MSDHPTGLDRLWTPFRRLVATATAPLRWLGTYEFTIQATNGTTVDASPTDTTLGLPGINGVELRADTLAEQAPTVGKLCHIQFLNGNLAKPKCVWCQPDAQRATILGGSLPSARQTDATQTTSGASVPFTVVWSPTAAIPSQAGTITFTAPIPGTITGGSGKVTCG